MMAEETAVEQESKHNTLLFLQESCRELMRTVLLCPTKPDTVKSFQLGGGANSNHVILLRERHEVDDELFSANVDYRLAQKLSQDLFDTRTLNNTTDKEVPALLKHRIEELSRQVTELSSRYSQDQLLLDCLQKSSYMVEHMLSGQRSELSLNSRLMCDMIEAQTEVVSEILHTIKTMDKLKMEAVHRCRQHVETVQCCRKLSKQLQSNHGQHHVLDTTESHNHDNDDSLEAEIKQTTDSVSLLKHTLQCIIFGSGVDWAEDEELYQLTLSLGQAET